MNIQNMFEEILDSIPDKIQINLDEVKEFIRTGKFPNEIISIKYNEDGNRKRPLIVIWHKNPIYNIY